ncbi:hypothetical protein, partial [Sulfitobacter pontiacus]|uniref:hypothetical protein n=1 Tax=Sulfitobacter pontiacus TaxID=60137 RepID=UPI003D647DCF
HRRQSAADGRQKQGMEPLITEPADHRNQASGEFYFGTFGESSNGVDSAWKGCQNNDPGHICSLSA